MTSIPFGQTADGREIALPLAISNRHGLVTGATGVGKSRSLQVLAEGFSAAGVPVFAADIKGDLSGMATGCPTRFWDAHRDHGLPVQTSVDRMGALILGRMLGLNPVQEGTLAIAFKRAADAGHGHLDLDDLRAELADMLDMRAETCAQYGNITASSISAIQREILALEAQGAGDLFAEPGLSVTDLLEVRDCRGVVNLLHADTLMESPKLYACLLLWLLTELFRVLPEAGDLEKPKLVFFFDEAHLLFRDAPPRLLQTIERVVRLVRSKGVGVYFITQSPADVPDIVLAQLGNRVQHALRAYSPRDQKLVKASAKAFRPKPGLDVEGAITSMAVGEALVSFLDRSGVPVPVERVKVNRPATSMAPISDVEREAIMLADPMHHRYTGDNATMRQAFGRRWRAERGLPALPEAAEPYREGEWMRYVPDLTPPPPKTPLLIKAMINGALAIGCFWFAAKLLL